MRELLAGGSFFWLDVHDPGGGRPRDPARGVRLPSAVARGLVALRPAAEDRRLRRLRLPRRLRRLERRGRRRARRGALLLLRPLPRHAAPRRGAVARRRCASATSSGTRRSTIRRGSCTRSSTASSTASSRASRRSTTGSTSLEDEIFRDAGEAELQEIFSMKRALVGDAQGDLARNATSSPRSSSASSRSRA